jgi:hypothetical protein
MIASKFRPAGVYLPITNSWPWFTRIFCHAPLP